MGSRSTVTCIIRPGIPADYKLGFWVRFLIGCSSLLLLLTPHAVCEDQYLLMKPISSAVRTGKFAILKAHSKKKLSVNLESPFHVNGYLLVDKFVEDLEAVYSQFEVTRIQWVTQQIEPRFAVESLNVSLKNQRSQKRVNYKFIFFMTKVDKEWKIYYLRGLNL